MIRVNYNRKSIRLKDYDYSQPGEYFITICTYKHECIFGEIIGEEMKLSPQGKIVQQCWIEIPNHFPNVELDAYVIMPNHMHGIIILNEIGRGEVTSPLHGPTLGKVVAYFKYQSTKKINALNGIPGDRVWQRNYYEHIIRDDKDLNNTRDYIENNILKWFYDSENVNINGGDLIHRILNGNLDVINHVPTKKCQNIKQK